MEELKPKRRVKEPSIADAARSMAIRCASKQGHYVSEEDRLWNRHIYRNFKRWYAKTERTVFELTKPFGAR